MFTTGKTFAWATLIGAAALLQIDAKAWGHDYGSGKHPAVHAYSSTAGKTGSYYDGHKKLEKEFGTHPHFGSFGMPTTFSVPGYKGYPHDASKYIFAPMTVGGYPEHGRLRYDRDYWEYWRRVRWEEDEDLLWLLLQELGE